METIDAVADEPAAMPLNPADIAKQQAQAAANDQVQAHPDIMPPSKAFNDMASKLEAYMKEATAKPAATPDKSTAPDNKQVQTDSKTKLPAQDDKAKATPAEPADDPANKTITSAKAADWKALKEKRDQAEKTAAELKTKLDLTSKEYEEFRKNSVNTMELEKIRAEAKTTADERQKLKEKLELVALEKSDEFNGFYKAQFDASLAKARTVVGKDHAEKIEALLALPPSKWRNERLNEIREGIESGFDQGQLDIAVAAYDSARMDRDSKLKDSKTNYARLEQRRMEDAVEAQQKQAIQTEAAKTAVLQLAQANVESFKRGEDKEHNAFVEESEQYVDRFFKRQLGESELALLPVLAREAKRYAERVVPSLEKELAEAKAALKQYQESNASPGGEGRPAGGSAGDKATGFVNRFNELWPAGNR